MANSRQIGDRSLRSEFAVANSRQIGDRSFEIGDRSLRSEIGVRGRRSEFGAGDRSAGGLEHELSPLPPLRASLQSTPQTTPPTATPGPHAPSAFARPRGGAQRAGPELGSCC